MPKTIPKIQNSALGAQSNVIQAEEILQSQSWALWVSVTTAVNYGD